MGENAKEKSVYVARSALIKCTVTQSVKPSLTRVNLRSELRNTREYARKPKRNEENRAAWWD